MEVKMIEKIKVDDVGFVEINSQTLYQLIQSTCLTKQEALNSVPKTNRNNLNMEFLHWEEEAHSRGETWFGEKGMNFGEALLTKYWDKGLDLIHECSAKVFPYVPEFKSIRRQRRMDIDGNELDVDRIMVGTPECWELFKRQEVKDQFVHITVDIAGNANISANNLKWTGAACAALADSLENKGYVVKITSTICTRGLWKTNNDISLIRILVKDYGEPVNLKSLGSTIVFPGFFRGRIFYTLYNSKRQVYSNLGRHMEVPKIFQGQIHIERAHSFENAIETVKLKISNHFKSGEIHNG